MPQQETQHCKCSASDANVSATHSATVATHPGVLLLVRLTSQESAPHHSSSLSAAAVEETTQPTTGAVQSGRRPRRRLLSGRLPCAARWAVHPTLPSPRRHSGRSRLPNRRVWDKAGTTWSVGAESLRLPLHPLLIPLPVLSLQVPLGMTLKPPARRATLQSQRPKSRQAANRPQRLKYSKPRSLNSLCKPLPRIRWPPPEQTTRPLRRSPIPMTNSRSMHVWNSPLHSSHPSQPSPLGQLARGLCSKVVILFVADYGSTTHTD
jgi:hypothetical protein